MRHLDEMLKAYDNHTERLLKSQLTGENSRRQGAFSIFNFNVDTRSSGFGLAHLMTSYVTPKSRFHLDPAVAEAMKKAFSYLKKYQRPGGCLDLCGCNFASPPDTAFTMNSLLNAWWLLEKYDEPEAAWLREPTLDLLTSCAEGIAAGGFHTPNHRWAIASCLKCVANITGRKDFSDRADQYLNEGLDVNEDGEFAERSAGGYNKVNDDQMIRLFIATGDKRFLEASEANLRMMLKYFDPDNSVFTCNSTRQDYGTKVYAGGYYILFLLTGYLLGKKDLAAYAEFCYETARAHGDMISGVEWLLLYDDMADYTIGVEPDMSQIYEYNYHFKDSRIARVRKGDMTMTVMDGRANCLYFQKGSMTMYMVIYENLCEKRNFIPDSMEAIEGGYRLSFHQDSWYYKPFWPKKPETSDWWAMNNPVTRERFQGVALDTFVDVKMVDDGIEVRVHTEGLDWLPLRVELGFPAGCKLRNDAFLMDGKAGESILLKKGALELTARTGEKMVIMAPFAEHGAMGRSGGAYPQSQEHFTVYMTAYTPVDKVFKISTVSPFANELLDD